jgi:hypothetical protein
MSFGISIAALSTLLLPVLCGCAREANPPGAEIPAATDDAAGRQPAETRYRIGTSFANYYESSPAQGRPPDGEIPPGTIVELVEKGGSYARVRWDGKTAWVAMDALVAE